MVLYIYHVLQMVIKDFRKSILVVVKVDGVVLQIKHEVQEPSFIVVKDEVVQDDLIIHLNFVQKT